jgi:hypothetical protein
MSSADDEVLLLLDLDFECSPVRWARLRDAAWWVAVGTGSVMAMFFVLHATYGFRPPHFPA